MAEMIGRLAGQGVRVTYDAVERAAGEESVVIGRPHLAAALVEAGHASSVWDAFDRLIGDAHPAFVPTQLIDPAGAVEGPPAPRPLDFFPVRIENGIVKVDCSQASTRRGFDPRQTARA